MKLLHKSWIAVYIFFFLMLITCTVLWIGGRGNYTYRGYVQDIVQDNSDTVIELLSGTKRSRFTVEWYTKATADDAKREIREGDYIMLSATKDNGIKEMHICDGYSTEGKLVYVDGLICPFLLATEEETGVYYLVSIVTHDDETLAGMNTGDTVRFYHSSPVYTHTLTTHADASEWIKAGTLADLSVDEIDFIESKGYLIAKD